MSQPATDETLIAEFATGRRAALEELARRYERPLLGLAQGLLNGDATLAQDAVQETWVRLIRFAGQFNGRSRFKTWIYRIAINQCRTLQSSPPREALGNTHNASDFDKETIAQAIATRNHASESGSASQNTTRTKSIFDPIVAREESAELHAALDRLGMDQRNVLLLCYHAGMTHPEAADILDIPLGTLKSRLSTALAELRRMLAKEDRS